MNPILMLTPYLPYPPVSGGRMRTYSLIKRLCQTYQITLVCFGRPEEKEFDLSPLRDLCELIVIDRDPSPSVLRAALMTVTALKPITMRLYTSEGFRQTVKDLLNNRSFEVIHVESFYMMRNIPSDCTLPVLLAEPAIEYIAWQRHARVAQPVYQRPGIALEALKMRVFEPRAWRQADCIGVMSEIDAGIVRRVLPNTPIALTPNGVDIDYFTPAAVEREPDSAIFMGDYKYFPNTDAMLYFIETIMPLIRTKRPHFKLTLLGKEPPPELAAFGADPQSGVRVMGLVEDTRPYLQKAALFICPLRSGSGTRFKLLEALACGCPVVSTTIGCEGLEAVSGEHMLIGDTPQDFATMVLQLLEDKEKARRLGESGREWVVQNHAWEKSAGLVADLYRQLVASR